MATYPTDLRYTEKHAWVRPGDKLVTIGLTQFAADRLGAIGFVEPPYPGEVLRSGAHLARMSSDTGSAAIQMPCTGQVNSVNAALEGAPGLLNSDPYGDGWIARLEPGDLAEIDGLMDAAGYEAFLAADGD